MGAGRVGLIFPHRHADQNAELRKYNVFSASETVVCSGIDLKKNLKHVLKRLFRDEGANLQRWSPRGNILKSLASKSSL